MIIKIRFSHPFIYFFLEPNLVLVYKLKNLNYITISDLNDKLESFNLKDGDHFELFDHKSYQQSDYVGYFLKQIDLKNMVEEINNYIQRCRQTSSELNDKNCAVHIVSTEWAAGTLKVGLERPKIVIGFPDFFSMGPLWKLEEKAGQDFRIEWLMENINFEEDDYVYQNKLYNVIREFEDIPKESPIYLWHSNNADEQIGLRFFLYLLRNKANNIYLINSTDLHRHYKDKNIIHTGRINPMDIKCLFKKNTDSKPLSEMERSLFQREWNVLSQNKSLLRVWKNNEIKEVQESHYDPLILDTLERLNNLQGGREFIKSGKLIGEILTKSNELISDLFLEYRIRHLIYSGVLELKGIPKSMRHYSVKKRI
jgi:hypothetical protein